MKTYFCKVLHPRDPSIIVWEYETQVEPQVGDVLKLPPDRLERRIEQVRYDLGTDRTLITAHRLDGKDRPV